MKVYITKYALTTGIMERSVEVCHGISDKMVSVKRPGFRHGDSYHKPDWHETLEAANKHAEEMRHKKIISLQKQIKKLEELKFTETS